MIINSNLRGIKNRKGRLETCPGISGPSASGKIMRPLPSYFTKKEEEVTLASNDPYLLQQDPSIEAQIKEDPEEEGKILSQ